MLLRRVRALGVALLPLVLLVELVIDEALLALDVSKHVLALGQADEVREHLRVLVVKLAQLRQAHARLGLPLVEAFEELIDVVEDEVVFEDADDARLLVVDQIVHHLQHLKLFVAVAVLAAEVRQD